ncbi:1-acyl-sn-glycerol-3-phosphate acyltransferase [Myceligenerans salitolerans]|uniref:1-acyl-sn-glycerol-3-phosphate acyltransferase n=1 Tax=Myceligenerans salitolerans TaxID=1230528 RepID=A0ABS3ID42_9MICO|nr:1-acyl-sn-glycerol-3-phosphate acyltransferase [Myceligenerans salitolerans]MBO0609962.1 1-acyl-sn-glycerol-3-phosphate acyltransferase [Myceligenerans salitolerans]
MPRTRPSVVTRAARRTGARLVWLCTGYRFAPSKAPDEPTVFVGAPHTSNTDFFLMLAIAWELDVRIKFLIKDSWLRGPFGGLIRALGGVAVDRNDPAGLVDQLLGGMRTGTVSHLVVTPEGTRGAGSGYWKSGFYRIARAAGMPVTLGYVDGDRRVAGLGPSLRMTGDVRADMDRLRAFYADKSGVRPENRVEPRLRAEDDPDEGRATAA